MLTAGFFMSINISNLVIFAEIIIQLKTGNIN